MDANDFLNFQEALTGLKYSVIPFSKITELKLTKSWFEVGYKCSHTAVEYNIGDLKSQKTRGKSATVLNLRAPKLMKTPVLNKSKIDTIKSMYKWMPTVDKEYYEAIFRKFSSQK